MTESKKTFEFQEDSMKINLKQKLTSRKLWVAIIGIVVGLATAFGVPENEYAPIAGNITAIISAVTYIIGEAKIDTARIEAENMGKK